MKLPVSEPSAMQQHQSSAICAGRCWKQTAASWAMQVVAALILGQTLFFKFTAAEEPVFIFTKLGAEPWGRVGSGVVELVAVVLLLVPRTAVLGAALTIGVMLGAIGAHLGPLGIVVLDDGGLLFGLAVAALACGAGVLVIRRFEVGGLVRVAAGMLSKHE